jgi:hypothetical protein
MTEIEPTYVAETLAWCNERRAERGKRPLKRLPKGIRGDAKSCPCGKATGLKVDFLFYLDDRKGPPRGILPDPVRAFVRQFDWGLLPQYEAKS